MVDKIEKLMNERSKLIARVRDLQLELDNSRLQIARVEGAIDILKQMNLEGEQNGD